MRRPNQRRERLHARQKRRWTVFVVLGCAFMGYFTYSFFFDTMGFMKYLSMKRTQAEIASEIQALKEKNTRLKNQIEAVKHDPATLESLARERLGMVRKDETVYLFVPDPAGKP
ncbi:MAG: septum formation initiator family protein [Nitrospirae bacterium]|nr:MAG: septum formation initiator family protein [Nitrospirota bacterium]